MTYFNEIKRTMEWVAKQPDTIFVGQTVAGPGTFMYQTLRDVPKSRTLEMPINESFQMQFVIGLALAGYVPISVYPRQNFMLIAMSDLVNMLDKIPAISENKILPKMIIRVAAGPYKPVHPGHQHVGNYAEGFKKMFTWIDVKEIEEPEDVFPAYQHALTREDGRATMLIEHGNYYGDK